MSDLNLNIEKKISISDFKYLKAHIPGLLIKHVKNISKEDSSLITDDFVHMFYAECRKKWLENYIYPVHAACLEVNGEHILLVGDSGSGKTTNTLNLIFNHNSKLFSGDKTLVKFENGKLHAISGTKSLTLLRKDSVNWPEINDKHSQTRGTRFIFDLDDSKYCKNNSVIIDKIFILKNSLNDTFISKIDALSGIHTLYPIFLDTKRADVITESGLFDGNVNFEIKDYLQKNLKILDIKIYNISGKFSKIGTEIFKICNKSKPKTFLFGICGLGSGHTYRQLPIIDELLKRKNNIIIFAYGFSLNYLEKYYHDNILVKIFPVINPFIPGTEDGLEFKNTTYDQKGQNVNGETLSKLKNIVVNYVISDYEKISAEYSYALNIPLITIDQQSKYIIKGEPIDEIQRLSLFFPKASKRLALSFFKINEISSNQRFNITVMPPILRPEILNAMLPYEHYESSKIILVYSSLMYPLDIEKIKKITNKITDYKFIFFPNNEKNIKFVDTLIKCDAIITRAGHSLLSEAMYLRKPVLAIPSSIYEQQMNANIIYDNDFGMKCSMDKISRKKIEMFIRFIYKFKLNIKKDVNNILLGGNDPNKIIDLIMKI